MFVQKPTRNYAYSGSKQNKVVKEKKQYCSSCFVLDQFSTQKEIATPIEQQTKAELNTVQLCFNDE